MSSKKISIATDFSEFPEGRTREDGPFSGQALREDHLAPALRKHDIVLVDLSGVLGYSAAFLEEAFGGLVKNEGFDAVTMMPRFDVIGGLKSDRILLKKFIWRANSVRWNWPQRGSDSPLLS